MEGWNFNLNSFHAVAGDYAGSLLFVLVSCFGVLDADKPLELGFEVWLRSVGHNIVYVKSTNAIASIVGPRVNSLHLFEANVRVSFLRHYSSVPVGLQVLHWFVVLCSQVNCCTDWVPKPN